MKKKLETIELGEGAIQLNFDIPTAIITLLVIVILYFAYIGIKKQFSKGE